MASNLLSGLKATAATGGSGPTVSVSSSGPGSAAAFGSVAFVLKITSSFLTGRAGPTAVPASGRMCHEPGGWTSRRAWFTGGRPPA